ncbi:T9SS type A sorting domain-containing protein [Fibrobacterota bacterium]
MTACISHTRMVLTCAAVCLLISAAPAQNINISGMVINSSSEAIPVASVELENAGLTAVTGTDGRFSLTSATDIYSYQASPSALKAAIYNGLMSIKVIEQSEVTVTTYSLQGKELTALQRTMEAGTHSLRLPQIEAGIYFFKVTSGGSEVLLKGSSLGGSPQGTAAASLPAALEKQTSTAQQFQDVLLVTANGYLDFQMDITNPDTSGLEIVMTEETELELFSFFVTSMAGLQELSENEDGFGGDLRFGETGPGAGLRGADKICETIAEMSMPGSSAKGWRAFLSVAEDENGQQVDAIDRIGEGPWYDRVGRLLAPTIDDLLNERPQNGDPTIQNDLTNEDGIPNHQPDPNQPQVDNHHMITGTDEEGRLYSEDATCNDWTSAGANSGRPRCGFAWPRGGRAKAAQGGISGANWMTSFDASGCLAGIWIEDGQGGGADGIIGSGGGYGGFYCFALNP